MVQLFSLCFLYKANQVLLLRRKNALIGNGLYSLPGGKVEAGEQASAAAAREAHEEVGLSLKTHELKLVHTFHRKADGGELVALCFGADISHQAAPYNKEPHKHDMLDFFDLNNLPPQMLAAHKQAIECIRTNTPYSEHGWNL